MGAMSYLRDERLIALGLGVAAVGCLAVMRSILLQARDEAEIPPTPQKSQYITQKTEDSLKLGTLDSLWQHYNFAIRDTTLRIVAGRAVNDDAAIDELFRGITSEDYEERTKTLRALTFALEDSQYRSSLMVALHSPRGYRALVRCLELGLGDVEHEKLDDPLYDEYYLRDVGEQRCLMLVTLLIQQNGVERLVEADFVKKWLAKQPWGDTDEERRKNFALYVDRKKNRISDICLFLRVSKAGRKALIAAKLATKSRRPKREKSSNIRVVHDHHLACEGEHATMEESLNLLARASEQSLEEQRLRRRHREAMVLNDGTHTLDRGDIIERE